MSQAIPARIHEQAQAAVSDWAAHVAEMVAAGTVSVELGPWLAARLCRRDAEWLLTTFIDMEQQALAAAGLPSDLTDDGVDLDDMETLCRQCPAVVRLEQMPSGKFMGVERDGTVHQHRTAGAALDASDRRQIAALFTPATDTPRMGLRGTGL